MRPKAESTVTSWKSRANNLIVLVKCLLKITSNNGFHIISWRFIKFCAFKRSLGLNCHLKSKLCTRAHDFFQ